MRTRTGQFPIGFRAGWSDWQKDLASLATWGDQTGFELLDLGPVGTSDVETVKQAGLDVKSVDLLSWSALVSDDDAKRKNAVAENTAHIEAMADQGVNIFFTVVIPDNPEKTMKEDFKLAVDSYAKLADVAEKRGAVIAIEGWPGAPPYLNLCCNPETYRAMFQEVRSPGLGINFDPSHLVRMGIDVTRFIEEFADRVAHVHGKDTEILTENLYDVGLYQVSMLRKPIFCGEYAWRYTIPGHGVTRWSYCFDVLSKVGYRGAVCVELEDASFNGTEEGEKAGLIAALHFLASA